MLKRPRPCSPPPSFSPLTPPEDLPLDLLSIREAKKRRILPPTLDGHARGYIHSIHDNDGRPETSLPEEYNPYNDSSQSPLTGEYRHTNRMLYELHASHQLRVETASSSHDDSHPFSYPPTSTPSHPHNDFARTMPSQHTCTAEYDWDERRGVDLGKDSAHLEEQRVKQRYEDFNKLLGALFLSRRRPPNGNASVTNILS